MTTNGSFINTSSTVCAPAGAVITHGAFIAVAFKDGNFVQCDDSLTPFGITIVETAENTPVGEDITAVIKDICLWRAGAAFEAGAALTTDSIGRAVIATEGKYVLGYALEASSGENELVQVQITKSGKA